jgi:transketolase C-terminal domain/subunit
MHGGLGDSVAQLLSRNTPTPQEFVAVNDSLRIKRLIRFYRDVKKLRRDLYKKIILERESEEVIFVKKSASSIF